jgi:tripartite-type tricarboxylate transporter receptor subunit TctC
LPNVPTIAEAGVPGYEASAWFTIAAPTKTPTEIIEKINGRVNAFIKTEDGRQRPRAAHPGNLPQEAQIRRILNKRLPRLF